jgi:hypothetical protein
VGRLFTPGSKRPTVTDWRGPGPHGRPRWPEARAARPWQQRAGRLAGDDGEARERPGRGPAGPGAYPGDAGEVGLAGGGAAVAKFGGGALRSGEESAVVLGAAGRFRRRGARGRDGGAPRLVGGAGGGAECRR